MTARKSRNTDEHKTPLSVCSICGATVWSSQPHEWSKQRWALGIIHTDCEEAA